MSKRVLLKDFLTEEEIVAATKLYRQWRNTGKTATMICDEIIQPNIARINKALGQENDPKYLAYLVEYSCTMAVARQETRRR